MSLSPNEIAALLPVAIPAAVACVLPIAALDKDQGTQKWIRGAMFVAALVALAGAFLYISRLWSSGMQPSLGHLHMDRLSQFTGIFVLVTGALTVLQLWDHLHQEGWVKGEILSLLLLSITGMMIFSGTTHLLLLFLGLELLSIPLYALTASVRMRATALEGGMKYFLTGAVAAACFLMGSALIYGTTGTLDAAEAGRRLLAGTLDPLATAGAALLLLGFLFKVSAVPFHQWTPDVYEAAPHPITAFMSVATKGVALVALLRIFPLSMAPMGPLDAKMKSALAVLAVLTLIIGNLTALAQRDVKRILAYSSISHAGYLLLGFVAGTEQAHAAVLFYLAGYLAMNMGAFGLLTVLGLVGDRTGLEHLRGKGWARPEAGFAAILCLFSLAGIPPMAGFFGKYMIFKELILQGHVGLAVVGVLASLVSMGYYLRIVIALFLEKPSETQLQEEAERPAPVTALSGATLLVSAAMVLVIGLFPGLVMNGFALRAIQDVKQLIP